MEHDTGGMGSKGGMAERIRLYRPGGEGGHRAKGTYLLGFNLYARGW